MLGLVSLSNNTKPVPTAQPPAVSPPPVAPAQPQFDIQAMSGRITSHGTPNGPGTIYTAVNMQGLDKSSAKALEEHFIRQHGKNNVVWVNRGKSLIISNADPEAVTKSLARIGEPIPAPKSLWQRLFKKAPSPISEPTPLLPEPSAPKASVTPLAAAKEIPVPPASAEAVAFEQNLLAPAENIAEHGGVNWAEVTEVTSSPSLKAKAAVLVEEASGPGLFRRTAASLGEHVGTVAGAVGTGLSYGKSKLGSGAKLAGGFGKNLMLAGVAGGGLLALGAVLSSQRAAPARRLSQFNDGEGLAFSPGSSTDLGGVAMPALGQAQSSNWMARLPSLDESLGR